MTRKLLLFENPPPSSSIPDPEPDPDKTCPICQELIGTRHPDGTIETWATLPCGHFFGDHCIKRYLFIAAHDQPSCPICRDPVHHRCGHPVLPIVLGDRAKERAWGRGEKNRKGGRFFPEGMPSAPAILCNYCRDPHARQGETIVAGGQVRSQPPGPPGSEGHTIIQIIRPAQTHESGKWWRTPLRWLSKLVPTGRITKRRRTFSVAMPGRMGLSTSSSSSSTNSEIGWGFRGAAAGQRRVGTNGTDRGGWQGPRIDRWPRERDLAWEKWYLEQTPRGV